MHIQKYQVRLICPNGSNRFESVLTFGYHFDIWNTREKRAESLPR